MCRTVSTKSRRSVDSLADAALAVMSKNKDFLAAMKDELGMAAAGFLKSVLVVGG